MLWGFFEGNGVRKMEFKMERSGLLKEGDKITVTEGVEVTVNYPAEAWMTAADVQDYFDGTLKPQLAAMIEAHNTSGTAHSDLRVLTDDTVEATYKLGVENGLLYLQLQEPAQAEE